MNDLLQKSKGIGNYYDFLLEFEGIFPIIVDAIVKNNFYQVQEKLIRILGIFVDKAVYTKIFLDKFIDRLQAMRPAYAQSQDPLLDALPPDLPQIPDEILNFMENKAILNKNEEKLQKLLGDGLPAGMDVQKTDVAEIRRTLDLKKKYCSLVINNYHDMFSLINKNHMNSVIELKLLMQKIEALEKIHQEMKESE